MALDELDDAEAIVALADQIVCAVRRREVAQYRRRRADGVEVGGARLHRLRIALQQKAEGRCSRAAACRGERALTPDGERQHMPGKSTLLRAAR